MSTFRTRFGVFLSIFIQKYLFLSDVFPVTWVIQVLKNKVSTIVTRTLRALRRYIACIVRSLWCVVTAILTTFGPIFYEPPYVNNRCPLHGVHQPDHPPDDKTTNYQVFCISYTFSRRTLYIYRRRQYQTTVPGLHKEHTSVTYSHDKCQGRPQKTLYEVRTWYINLPRALVIITNMNENISWSLPVHKNVPLTKPRAVQMRALEKKSDVQRASFDNAKKQKRRRCPVSLSTSHSHHELTYLKTASKRIALL